MTIDTKVVDLTKRRADESYLRGVIRNAIILSPRVGDYEQAVDVIYRDVSTNSQAKSLLNQAIDLVKKSYQCEEWGWIPMISTIIAPAAYATIVRSLSYQPESLEKIFLGSVFATLMSLSVIQVCRSINYQKAANEKLREGWKYLSEDTMRQVYGGKTGSCCGK